MLDHLSIETRIRDVDGYKDGYGNARMVVYRTDIPADGSWWVADGGFDDDADRAEVMARIVACVNALSGVPTELIMKAVRGSASAAIEIGGSEIGPKLAVNFQLVN